MRKVVVFLVIVGVVFIVGNAFSWGPLTGGPKGDPQMPTALPWAVPPPQFKNFTPSGDNPRVLGEFNTSTKHSARHGNKTFTTGAKRK